MIDWTDDEHRQLIEGWMKEAMANPPSPAAWAVFVSSLQKAAVDFNATPTPLDGASVKQANINVVSSIITSIFDLIKTIKPPLPSIVNDSIFSLVTCFFDLSNGTVPDLFTPDVKRPGRKPDKVAIQLTKATAARAMSELMRAGISSDQAASTVSQAVKSGKKPGYSICTKKKVTNWRAKYNEGPDLPDGGRSVGLIRYECQLPPEAGETPQTKADFLLAILRDRTRSWSPS